MKILAIRLSALGDVAIAANVINAALEQNPNIQIFVLTKKQFTPIFKFSKAQVISFDPQHYKGLIGLIKLFFHLKEYNFDAIADLHSVIRTWILDTLFFITGQKLAIIKKDRKARKKLTRQKNKKLKPLKPIFERYKDVFQKIGININLDNFQPKLHPKIQISTNFIKPDLPNLGIAPFAAHKTKEYPPDLMENVLKLLENHNINILIFGGGKREKQIAENWEKKFKNVTSLIGKTSLETEIIIMSKLDLMLTMDSGNMHLAALSGTETITIWGGTHPYAGYIPFKTYKPENAIQIDLPCRPCSIFGKETCNIKTFDCLKLIPPKTIYQKILSKLYKK